VTGQSWSAHFEFLNWNWAYLCESWSSVSVSAREISAAGDGTRTFRAGQRERGWIGTRLCETVGSAGSGGVPLAVRDETAARLSVDDHCV